MYSLFELRRTSKMALQYIGMTILRVLQLKNRRRENLPSVQEAEDGKEEEKGKEEEEKEEGEVEEKEEDEVDDEEGEEDDVFTPLEEEVDGETNKPSSKAGNSSTSSPPPSPRKKQVDTLTLRPGRTLQGHI